MGAGLVTGSRPWGRWETELLCADGFLLPAALPLSRRVHRLCLCGGAGEVEALIAFRNTAHYLGIRLMPMLRRCVVVFPAMETQGGWAPVAAALGAKEFHSLWNSWDSYQSVTWGRGL